MLRRAAVNMPEAPAAALLESIDARKSGGVRAQRAGRASRAADAPPNIRGCITGQIAGGADRIPAGTKRAARSGCDTGAHTAGCRTCAANNARAAAEQSTAGATDGRPATAHCSAARRTCKRIFALHRFSLKLGRAWAHRFDHGMNREALAVLEFGAIESNAQARLLLALRVRLHLGDVSDEPRPSRNYKSIGGLHFFRGPQHHRLSDSRRLGIKLALEFAGYGPHLRIAGVSAVGVAIGVAAAAF